MNNGNRKSKFLEVEIKYPVTKDDKTKLKTIAVLYKIGEYVMGSDMMWTPSNKWINRMVPGDVQVSHNIGNPAAIGMVDSEND